MKVRLKVWRQEGPNKPGRFETYETPELNPNMSFLEMLDAVNEELIRQGKEPIAFAHDCREGICGTCGITINGQPHGPGKGSATCQIYMRKFRDGETITLEPFRAKAFPVIKDLIVDRSALDRIILRGGFISVRAGSAPDANTIPIPKRTADLAMEAAQCIGCGACAAACPNASAMLFVGAKASHLGLLPQGQPERFSRAAAMAEQMEEEGFGACRAYGACEEACPKEIKLEVISRLNRDFTLALLKGEL
ncbi:MAG: succinate dehydrogenase/fumarate reductase iron-sulfur subunit [Verrucomicrobia bacterium]|nr:succinate dehydrogenase/fumarate reductase iron-sulfur subunit [Verrucomicrobiota bacterium]